MALEAAEARRQGGFDEPFFQVFRGQAEGDVHEGPAILPGRSAIEIAAVDEAVERIRFFPVDFRHLFQAAHGLLQPFEDQLNRVDGKTGRGVEHGVLLGEGGVFEHGGQVRRGPVQEVLADDDHADAGRADVLLGAGVDKAEGVGVEGTAHDVRGHVRDEGDGSRVGKFSPLGPLDGVVGRDVGVGRLGVKGDVLGDVGKVPVLGRGDHVDGFPLDPDFLDGLGGPGSGVDVVGRFARRQEIHGRHAELEGSAALHEEDAVRVAQVEEPLCPGHGVVHDRVERFGTVAHLGDGHPRPLKIEKRCLNLLEHRQRQGRGPGVEVVRSFLAHVSSV